jgi:transposase
MFFEHVEEYSSQWAAIQSIAQKICCSPETLRQWVRQAKRDEGLRPGLSSTDRDRMKELERENREFRRANEVIRKEAAFFAQAEQTLSRTGTSSAGAPRYHRRQICPKGALEQALYALRRRKRPDPSQ